METEQHGVRFLVEDRIAWITLNQPDKLNALPVAGLERLAQIWQRVRDDDAIWVAVVTGTGERSFCSGIDLGDIETDDAAAQEKDRTDPLVVVGPLHQRCYKPVIVAVNGLCAGIALDFVTEADIVIAADHATFFDPHVTIGTVSAHEMVQLSRRLPLGAVLRMNALGRYERMTAARACELGLVTEVVPIAALMERARTLAETVLKNSPRAVQLGKELLIRGLHLGVSDATELAEDLRKSHIGSPDYLEGPKAFMEKRPPQWRMR
jgi:enoyl-CoA hydratase/carnithine racemase